MPDSQEDTSLASSCLGLGLEAPGGPAPHAGGRRQKGAAGRRSGSVGEFSVLSDSLRPRGLELARLLCPWDPPGEDTGVTAISSSRGSIPPRDPTSVSGVSCIDRWILHH